MGSPKRQLDPRAPNSPRKRRSLGLQMTSIPTPSLISASDIDLQHIKRLRSINENLKAKPSPNLTARIENVENTYKTDIASLSDTLKNLQSQKSELEVKSNTLENELIDIRRSLKKSLHDINETKKLLASSKKKSEYLEESIMQAVLAKEREINAKLDTNYNQLLKSYQEIQSQLEVELQRASSYDDKEIRKEIDDLTSKKAKLISSIQQQKLERSQLLEAETNKLKAKLAQDLKAKLQDKAGCEKQLEDQKSILNDVNNQFNALSQQMNDTVAATEKLQTNIDETRARKDQYNQTKQTLVLNNNQLKQELQRVQLEQSEWDSKYKLVHDQYEESLAKYQQQQHLIRVMENVILDYEKTIRVIIQVPKMKKTINGNIESSQTISIDDRNYKFSKVCIDAFDDYEEMLKSAMVGNNCSIIHVGIQNDLEISKIYTVLLTYAKTFKRWEFSILVASKDSSDAADIEYVEFSKIDLNKRRSRFEFKIKATNATENKSFESAIHLVDLTSNSIDYQIELLNTRLESQTAGKDVDGDMQRLLAQCQQFSKCVYVATIERKTEFIRLLEICEKLNSTPSPYPHRNLT